MGDCHEGRNCLEVLPQAKDSYTVAAVRDGVVLRYDSRKDSGVAERI